MVARIVRLGTPRTDGEGVRIGTVRRPPRGVPRSEFSSGNWYDVWFPVLAPSVDVMKQAQGAKTADQWAKAMKRYRAEMAKPDAEHALELLAALSHDASFSIGCYCEDEAHCHRSVLRELLKGKGAKLA